MAALAIIQAIKDMIERHVDARTNLVQDVKVGDGGLWVQRADEFRSGETIVLKNNDKAEMHVVRCLDEVKDVPVIVLCEDVTAPFLAAESWVQKTHNQQIIEDIVLGNPDHLDNYPSITIEAKNVTREPFTLGTVSDQFTIEIGTWMDATNYSSAYETLLIITDKVEHSLFKIIAPLVKPFFATVLTANVQSTDTIIMVENSELAPGAIIWIENPKGIRRMNRVTKNLDAGVLELAFGVGFPFLTGDAVVHPLVHLYDPRIESISYDDAQDQDHLLKSSTITYSVKLQKLRRI